MNAQMENRNRFLMGIDVEIHGPALETMGCLALIDRAEKRLHYTPSTLGADKGYFSEDFLSNLFQ